MVNDKKPSAESVLASEIAARYRNIQIWMFWLGIVVVATQFYLGVFSKQGFPPSISHSYHTGIGDILVGCLCVVGIFLINYQSPLTDQEYWNVGFLRIPKGRNYWISTIAGLGAIGVALFPVDPRVADACFSIVENTQVNLCQSGLVAHGFFLGINNGAHFLAAAAFFGCIALLCFVVFPVEAVFKFLSDDQASLEGVLINIFIRPVMYFGCGAGIVLAIAMLYLDSGEEVTLFGAQAKCFFVWEVFAVALFTLAWGVKCQEEFSSRNKKVTKLGRIGFVWMLTQLIQMTRR